jgi:hypothetical protein
MSSKIKARQDKKPKRFIPDYSPEKGASKARRANNTHHSREDKREGNRRDWRNFEGR